MTFVMGLNRDIRRREMLDNVIGMADAGIEGMYLVVPDETTFISERDLQVHLGDRTSRHIEVVGLDNRLHTRIHSAIGHQVKCMDDGGRLLTMATALNTVRKKLQCFSLSATWPEFISQALNTCEMLMKNGVAPKEIAKADGISEGLRKKAEDISLIMDQYLSLCERSELDPVQEEKLLPGIILENGGQAFHHTHWFVDGYSDFTGVQAAILAALDHVSASMSIYLPCENLSDVRESSECTVNAANMLEEMVKKLGGSVQYRYVDSMSTDHPALSLLQNELCSSAPVRPHKVEGANKHVRLFEDPTPFEEIQHIAGTIMQAVRSTDEKKRVRYRDVSVVLPDYDRYAPIVERVFEMYGIPAYFASRTAGVDDMPVMQAVISALDAATRGFPTLEVVQFIKSGLLDGISMDDADRLESYALTWSIRGRHWNPHGGWKMHPDGWGREFTDEDTERLAELNEIREKAIPPLLEMGEALSEAGTAGACAVAVNAFLERIGFHDSLQRIVDGLVAAGDRQTAKEYAQLNELICNALEQIYGTISDIEIAQPADFAKMFRLICGAYKIDTIPSTLDQVMVFDVVDSRHVCSKIRYIAGCSDGVFPSYEAKGNSYIFSAADADEINALELGGKFPGATQQTVYRQLAEINSCIAGAKMGLIMSYAYGNETTPSPLYIRAQNLLPELAPVAGCGENGIYAADLLQAKACGRLLGRVNTKAQYSEIAVQLAMADSEEKESVAMRVWDKADWAGLSTLSESTIRKLYGDVIPLTASRSDAFASCRYFFFLRYGLGLREPPSGKITSPIFGSFAHAVLEGSFREIEKKGGFKEVPMSSVVEIAKKHIEKYTREKLRNLEPERYRYMYQRDCHEIIGILHNLCKEFLKSDFHATGFELKVGGKDPDVPAIYYEGKKMTGCYTGIIDRVDGAEDIEGKDYYRITDYKTGSKKAYDTSDILMGLSLQLILYNAAIKKIQPKTNSAGMLYVPAKENITTFSIKPDDETVEKAKEKESSRTGVILDNPAVVDVMEHSDDGTKKFLPVKIAKDGTVTGSVVSAEQIELLNRFGTIQMSKLVDDIASGDITANPVRWGPQRDACKYCFAKDACHKDVCGTKFRYRAKVSDEDFWTEIEKIVAESEKSAETRLHIVNRRYIMRL